MLNGIELKPCPFCGSDRVRVTKPTMWQAWCMDCKAIGATRLTEQEAAKAWNTRTPGWIPCSERMPSDNIKVLMAVKSGKNYRVTLGCRKNLEPTFLWFDGWYCYSDETVVYWQPLPNPPTRKEVQNDPN